jgi:hypothetical protein
MTIWKSSKDRTTCDAGADGMFWLLLGRCLLLGLLFDPEDESNMFLLNVIKFYQSTLCYMPHRLFNLQLHCMIIICIFNLCEVFDVRL